MAEPQQESTSTTDQVANPSNEPNTTEMSTENPASTENAETEENANENANEESTEKKEEDEDEEVQLNEEAIAEHERKIRLYQNRLDSSTDEEYRPTGMIELASSMADLCSAREASPKFKEENLATLKAAAEKARDAIEMVDEDYQNWAYVIASSANIFYTLYDTTKEPKHLDETIDASEKAVLCYVNKEFHARRSYRLAAQLQERWIIRTDKEDHTDLKAAIQNAYVAVDNSYLFNDVGKWRLILWSSLVAELAIINEDVESLDFAIDYHVGLRDGTIEQIDNGENDAGEKENAVYMNIVQLEMMYCWRWGLTKKASDLDLIVECVARNLGTKDCSRALMLKAAMRVFEMREITRHDKRFPVPILALKIQVEMLLEVWNGLPKTKNSHLPDLSSCASDARFAAFDLFERTGDAKWGWLYDDFNLRESRANVLQMGEKEPDADIVYGMMSSYGESVVLKRMICKFVIADPWEVHHVFLEDIKPENYIRKRNDDGTIELGLFEEDGEAYEWYIKEYKRTPEEKKDDEKKIEELKDEENKEDDKKDHGKNDDDKKED